MTQEIAFAELHYTDFGDVETFESLADRHGLRYIGRDVAAGPGATCFLYSDGDGLELWMASDPTTGEHRDKPDPETGYAYYTFIRGPREKAERLFRDVVETAPYIKGEFQPLQTEGGDEIVSYWDIDESTMPEKSGKSRFAPKRYPCPRDDCDGVFRQVPTVGRRDEYRCSECDERWPK